jgi:hypothetical protein
MLIDNLKDVKGGCEEHFADIDAFSIILKLQNRHWIDQDLTKMLDDLELYFENNQKVYSSFDKFKN